jgi:predicted PurR-regulated permease PerM
MFAKHQTPFHQKLALVLFILSALCVALIYGKELILPVLFSILLANILLPFTNYLLKKGCNKSVSILIPLILFILVGLGILYFLSSQIIHFMNDVPALRERINEVTKSFQLWFKESTNMTIYQQNKYFKDTVEDLKDNAPELVGLTFVSLTGILTYFVLMPLYTYLILYYRSVIKVFLISVFNTQSEKRVADILVESTTVAQKYLTGLSIETVLVFTLNTVGFLILGIKYAIFLALLAALLNLVPYVGMLVANVLCMIITLVSSPDPTKVLWVGLILAVVQVLDNNIGMPLIVGNKVRINALVTVIGVLVGGTLCGIPGMFLAIPGIAVIKVIFDKVPELQAWGILLGDGTEEKSQIKGTHNF